MYAIRSYYGTRKLVLTFAVTRQEVVRKDFPQNEATWDPADYALYLAPTSLGPIDGVVKELADKIVGSNTTVYSKAKAIYDWICENMYRDPNTKGCGPGNVCLLLQTPGVITSYSIHYTKLYELSLADQPQRRK